MGKHDTYTFSSNDYLSLKETYSKLGSLVGARGKDSIYVDNSPTVAMQKIRDKSNTDLLLFVNNIHKLLEQISLMHNFIYFPKTFEDIANKREDHWDILKDKCESDPMFKETWDELMVLLKLEED